MVDVEGDRMINIAEDVMFASIAENETQFGEGSIAGDGRRNNVCVLYVELGTKYRGEDLSEVAGNLGEDMMEESSLSSQSWNGDVDKQ